MKSSFSSQLNVSQKQTYKRWKRYASKSSKFFGSLSLFLGLFCLPAQPTHAEGSISLTPATNTGRRPHLLFNNGVSSGINLKTVIKVYVNAGETINLGSSANAIGGGRINYRPPSGLAGTCPITGVTGRITTRAQEVAGPLPNVGGYTPCIITAAQTTAAGSGIWEIDFVSPDVTNTGNPPNVAATANWAAQITTQGFVTAWDVTVRNSSGVAQPGRAYTNYLAASMGVNQDNAFKALIYVLTKDGYQYSIDTNGLDPFQFIFFSNNKGFKDTSGNPTYRSYDFTGVNPGTFPAGISVQNPGASDTSTDYTNKIFFNPIDSFLPSSASIFGGSTWLSSSPVPPPTPSSFTFVGLENVPGQAGTNQGGNFTFNASAPGPFQIILDLNQDGILGNANDRVLIGTASTGATTVFWDGKDGLGVAVPPSNSAYNATITLFAGEVHFPLLDAESNKGGLIIKRLNNPSPPTTPTPNPYWVYYNNTGMLGNAGLGGANAVAPNPLNGLLGQDSSTGAQKYGNSASDGFGNITGIDTWSYYPSQSVQLASGIVIRSADLRITKNHTPTTAVAGGLVTYIIDVTNFNNPPSSISDVVGASVTDILPSSLSQATLVSCSVVTGTGSCVSSSFTGNTFNAKVNLNSGATVRYVIRAKLAAGSTGNLTNTATITRTADVADPVDQDGSGGLNTSESATDVATIGLGADVVTTKTGPTNAAPGSTVTYTLSATNNGPIAAANVVITDNIGTGLTNVVASNGGTYDSVTGIVTFPAISSLANGATVTRTVSVTAPASGSITDVVSSTSSTGDPNPDNNDGSAPSAKVITTVLSFSKLLLVKRITAINGNNNINPNDNTVLNQFVNGGTNTDDDNHPNWPTPTNTYLKGAISAGLAKPGDEVEYTIYFLNTQNSSKNVKICDVVPDGQTFVPKAYNTAVPHPTEAGALPADTGIALGFSNSGLPTVPTFYLTNIQDTATGDRGRFYPAGDPSTPAMCKKFNSSGTVTATGPAANTAGAVVVEIVKGTDTIPAATGVGTPADSYGFIRFRAKVK
jgi:uncharacterized repeat protein (TIGR01451 family)